MHKKILYFPVFFLYWIFSSALVFAQAPGCPAINTGINQSLPCSTNCTSLAATVFQSGKTTSYGVSSIPFSPPSAFNVGTQMFINIDDVWSGIIDLPFNFCFYQSIYNKIVVGTNGLVTFDLSMASAGCAYDFLASCPTPGPPSSGGLYNNSIMGAYHDIDPSVGGSIRYLVTGTAPCRMFIMNYYEVPQYNCADEKTTQQIVFYETTNAIEVYIQAKSYCGEGVNDRAVIGIQNSTGLLGISPPGRNTGTWTANNEGWRFMPNGPPGYTIRWYDDLNNFIDTGLTVDVCPTETETYIAKATYHHCDGSQIIVTDSVTVIISGSFTTSTSFTGESCAGDDGTATVNPSSEASPYTYQWNTSPIQTGATATGLSQGTYIVTITGTGNCIAIDTAVVTGLSPPFADAGEDSSSCSGNSIQIGGSPTGPPGSVYNWSPSATLDNDSSANPTATPAGNISYIVTVTDTNGCSVSDTVEISVFIPPVASACNDTSICFPDTIQLYCSGGLSFSWSPPEGLSDANIFNPWVSPALTTTYIVTVTDINNCADTESVLITVNNLPPVDAGLNKTICTGDTVQIGGMPTGPAGSSFIWSPNTNITSINVANPSVFPASTIIYHVTVSDVNTCEKNDSITITVNSLPAVDAGNDTSICIGSTITLGGSPTSLTATNFTWSPSGTLNNSSLANPTATPVSNTNYIVIVSDGNTCENTDTVSVSLFALPEAVAGDDTAICIGDTIELHASGGVSYAWSPSAGLNTITNDSVEANPLVSTIYTVTVTDINGCNDSESISITVNTLPLVDAGNNTAICIGDTFQIGGSPTSSAGIDFAWLPNTDISSVIVSNPLAFPSSDVTYTVTVIDGNSCVNSDSILISVNNLPVADAGQDTTICNGFSVVIGGSPTGPLNSTIQWSPSTSLNNTITANPTATPSSSIIYTVTLTDTNGCVDTDEVSFIVNENPVADAGTGGTICVGDSLQLSGIGAGSFEWTPEDSLTNPNIFNPIAFPAVTTIYYFTVKDGNNCQGTDSVTVNVNQLPPANAGPDLWVCPNDSVIISATGGLIYSWTPSTGLSAINISNPKASPADTTEFFVTVWDANGCVNIDSMILDVGMIVPTDAGPDTSICIGDTIQIGGNPTAPTGSILSWNTSAGLSDTTVYNPLAFPQDTFTYYLTTTNYVCNGSDSIRFIVHPLPIPDAGLNVQVCLFDSVQLIASGGISYSWTPSDSLSDDSISDPLAFPTDTTAYYVNIKDVFGCKNVDSVLVIVNSLPGIVISNDVEICIGDSTQLSANGGTVYAWLPADSLSNDSINNPIAFPSDTTNYIVIVTDGNGCQNSDSVIVTVSPLPLISISGDFIICFGDTTQLTASGGVDYSWMPTTGLSDDSISTPLAFPSDTTMYVVIVSDSNSCDNKDSVTVTVNPLPIVFAGLDDTICIGDTTQLIASGGINYGWNPSAGLSDAGNDSTLAYPTDTTEYFVTSTDINGCENIDSVTVIVNSLPGIVINNDVEICIGDSTQIIASGGTDYVWLPADSLSNDSINNPIAFPSDTTNYMVIVTDGNGCQNSDSVIVTVSPLPLISISGDFIICFGDTTQLTSSGGTDYSWLPATGLNDDSISNPLAYPIDTTTYVVMVSDSNSCINLDSVTVIVNPLPIVIAGLDDTICIGDTTQLIASGGINYGWNPFAGLSDAGNDSTFAFPADTTEYFVTATDINGCENVDSVTVIVNSLPGIVISNDVEICIGDSTQLIASGGTNYVWLPADSLTNDSIDNPIAFPSDTTNYVVIVTDGNGCQNSDSVIVTVSPLPLISISGDFIICFGDTTQLTSSGGTDYSWLPATGLNDDSISNPLAYPIDTTTYVVMVSDSNACINLDSVAVTVNPLPIIVAGLDDTICIGDTTQLIASGGINYGWNPAASLSDAGNDSTLAYPTDTTEYFVSATDINGCENIDSVTVIVNSLPGIVISNDVEICIGDSTQLIASGGTNYVWLPADSLSNNSINNPIAFPSDTTNYVVIVTDGNGCQNSDSVVVTVSPLPLISISGDFIICFGESTQLSASGGTDYSWLPASGLSDDSLSNPLAFPSVTTNYVVMVSDSNSCVNLDSVTVIVNPLPIVIAGLDDTICIGDTTQLIASGGINYGWNPSAGLGDAGIDSTQAYPTDTTEYFVTATDINGCENVDSVTVIVNPLPGIVISNNVEICIGDSTQLIASGGTNYVWLPADSLSNDSINNPIAFPSDTTNYVVIVTDGNGCQNSDSVIVTVSPLPQISITGDFIICFGDTTQLTASGGVDYSWLPATGLSDDSISNPLAFPSDTTTYVVMVSDSNSCVNKDSVTVTVNPLPIVIAGLDDAICIGDTTQLIASGAINYTWNPAAGLTDSSNDSTLAFPSVSTFYFVTGTDSNSCVNVDSIFIIVNPPPIAEAGNDTSSCTGANVQLNAKGGILYLWNPPNGLSNINISNPVAAISGIMEYFVEVTDSNFCSTIDSITIAAISNPIIDAGINDTLCTGDTIQLFASQGYPAYLWSPSIYISSSTISNPVAFPVVSTEYFVTVVDTNGCSGFDSVMVMVNALPVVEAGNNTDLCKNDTIQLNASGATDFLWNPANSLSNINIKNPFAFPAATTEYFVQGTDSNNCINTDSITITVHSLPIADAGNDTAGCSGSGIQLNANAGAAYYQWFPLTGLNNPFISNPVATLLSDSIKYFLTFTDVNGCKAYDSVTIKTFSISIQPEIEICLGDSAALMVSTFSGFQPYSYLWNPTNGISNPGIANPTAAPISSINYSVTVAESSGCSDSAEINITVNEDPVADFSFKLEASCNGAMAVFENKSNNSDTYEWIFGDKKTSIKKNPEHLFLYNGRMDVTLIAINSSGCIDSSTVSQSIKTFDDYYDIVVPDVFTPNGDGQNDWFEIRFGNKLQECTDLQIFNRWGAIMFTSSGKQHSWDGRTFVGGEAPGGTYYYVFDIKGMKYKGAFTLIR